MTVSCALRSVVVAGALWALPVQAQPAAKPVVATPAAPAGQEQAMLWTYGSAEYRALVAGVYQTLLDHVSHKLEFLKTSTGPMDSVVAATPTDPQAIAWRPCTQATRGKPAVVFDVDETLVWNLGVEAYALQHPASSLGKLFTQWEQTGADKLIAIPGAKTTLDKLRAMGVSVIFNTNRSKAYGAQALAGLQTLGLAGPAVLGETLLLRGDVDGKDGKDGRRQFIADHYCVLAMVGDQMGDFSDAIDTDASGARRAPAEREKVVLQSFASLWGQGWFPIPNPVYGRWLQQGLTVDGLVPPEKRWAPPVEEGK